MPISEKQFQEFTVRVLSELGDLNAKVAEFAGQQELFRATTQDRFQHIDKKLGTINELLNGNGTPEKGIVSRLARIENNLPSDLEIRLDRIEQKQKGYSWFGQTTIGAAIGSIFSACCVLFTWLLRR
jgi:hypothetical protein